MKSSEKIALISDIHGNLPALEAVFKDLETQSISRVLCSGDILGISPFTNEVIEALQKVNAECILGNYDIHFLEYIDGKSFSAKKYKKEEIFAYKYNNVNISLNNLIWLKTLAETLKIKDYKYTIRMFHSFGGKKIEENENSDILKCVAKDIKEDIVIFGHTHKTFLKYIAGKMFINPGSVGKFSKDQTAASYAILELNGDKIKVSFEKANFNIDRCIEKLKQVEMPEKLIEKFIKSFNISLQNKDKIKSESKSSKDYFQKVLMGAQRYAEKFDDDPKHFFQVTKLSSILFHQLVDLHKLDQKALLILQSAALLHDVGWINGQVGHHKKAMQMILEDSTIPFQKLDRKLTALTARYHRKSIPSLTHKLYRELWQDQKNIVLRASAILRIADGLDNTHLSVVKDLNCLIKDDKIAINIISDVDIVSEIKAAEKKSNLMAIAFNKQIVFNRANKINGN